MQVGLESSDVQLYSHRRFDTSSPFLRGVLRIDVGDVQVVNIESIFDCSQRTTKLLGFRWARWKKRSLPNGQRHDVTEKIPPGEEMCKALWCEMEAALLSPFRVCVGNDRRREVDKVGSETFERIPLDPPFLLKPLDCLWRPKFDGVMRKKVEEPALSHGGFALAASRTRLVPTSTLKLERKANANASTEIGASLV